jgi:O-antigen/teichoic acid export membrane protein
LSLSRNVTANITGQAITALLALGFIPVYVRLLGAEGYGLVGVYSAAYTILGIVDSAIQTLLIRSAAQSRATTALESLANLVVTLELVLLAFGSLLVAATWLAAPYLADQVFKRQALSAEDIGVALIAMGVALSLRLFEGLYRACLMGLEKQVHYNLIAVAGQTLRWGGAAAVLHWVAASIDAFFWWQVGAALCSVLVLRLAMFRVGGVRPGGKPVWRELVQERRFIVGMIAISVGAVLLTQLDKLLLAKLVPLAELGVYTLATTAAGALMLPVAAIADAMYPRLVRQWRLRNNAAFGQQFHLGAQLVTVVAGTAACVGIVFAADILGAWTGDAELTRSVGPVFQMLLAGNLLNAFMWMPYRAQLAAGWTGLAARVNLIAVVILAPLILVVVPRAGITGAAWIWIALNAGYVLLGVHWMFKRLLIGEKLAWYAKDLALPLTTGAAPSVATALLHGHAGSLPADLLLAAAAAAAGLISAALAANRLRPAILNAIRIDRT